MLAYYDKVLAIDPNDIDALTGKAKALHFLERYQEAIEYFDKVLAIDPNDIDALTGKAQLFIPWIEIKKLLSIMIRL